MGPASEAEVMTEKGPTTAGAPVGSGQPFGESSDRRGRVLKVDQREQIRRAYFIEGKSFRQIARDGHHSRRTIRKALHDAGPPRYTLKTPRRRPVLEPFLAIVDRWLQEDLARPAKQRHTAHRIYDRLVAEHDFQGGESTVRQYVRQQRPGKRDVFIPLEHDPAEAQADWGTAKVYIDGRLVEANLFCLRLCYSTRFFVGAYPRQTKEAFYAGHVAAFEALGGVPRTITYDNLSTAVKKVLGGNRREEQQEFVAFRSHHLYESVFCRPGEGHEKGLVENLVGYARRNFLVPLPQVASFEELNAILQERCHADLNRHLRDGRTVAEAWKEEQHSLLPLPNYAWPCYLLRPARISGTCLVSFDGNRYSAPALYARRPVLVRASVDRVEIVFRDSVIAGHPRSYERGQDVLDPYHYLPVLLRKPRAFHQAKPVRAYTWPPVFQQALASLEERYPDGQGVKEYVRILALKDAVGEKRLAEAVELALRYRCVGVDAVCHLLHQMEQPWQQPLPLLAVPAGLAAIAVPARDLSQYNRLLAGA
jgi:transposase